ncbi:MAG: cysteine synthase A [Spirochaetes bacterium]|nr:cysteine synthase A [Spirochaetota bacterium]
MKFNSITEAIGNTPHLRLKKLFGDAEVWIKLERQNPGGSLKDRIALSMVEDAERKGILKPGGLIIEPTSGNTGIGLSMVAAAKGYKIIVVMPESMSVERRSIMAAYGAQFELTPREKGTIGAIERAKELAATTPGAWMPQQFENPANIEAHAKFTAQEVLRDFPEGIDALITGVGTGGHITGVGEILREKWPNLQIFAVEPSASAVISGGAPGPHPLQGLGTGFIPKNLHTKILTGTVQISKDEAFEYTKRAAREEALFAGISTGAALAAVAKKIPELKKGARILTFNYDTGERYLSIEGLFQA